MYLPYSASLIFSVIHGHATSTIYFSILSCSWLGEGSVEVYMSVWLVCSRLQPTQTEWEELTVGRGWGVLHRSPRGVYRMPCKCEWTACEWWEQFSKDSPKLSSDPQGDPWFPKDSLCWIRGSAVVTLFFFSSLSLFFLLYFKGRSGAVPRKISLLDDISSQCPIVWGKLPRARMGKASTRLSACLISIKENQ